MNAPTALSALTRAIPLPASNAQAVGRACRLVAPVWPLRSYVAVNPFLGFTGLPFAEAVGRIQQERGARMLMPRAWFKDQVASGRIARRDLADAAAAVAARTGLHLTVAAVEAALDAPEPQPPRAVATVAEVLDALEGGGWADVAVREIGRFCAAHWDEGQAAWASPLAGMPLFAAWREAMANDFSADVLGLADIGAFVADLPEDAAACALRLLDDLGLAEPATEPYLHRLLSGVGGWAAYARYRGWESELDGEQDDTVLELLAIRLAWEVALLRHGGDRLAAAWRSAVDGMGQAAARQEDAVGLVLQEAGERAFQRAFAAALAPSRPAAKPAGSRPAVQAAFCIDVRSEFYRRALESLAPDMETLGFAGFFGFAFELVPFGRTRGRAQAPVLLKPTSIVCEEVAEAGGQGASALLAGQRRRAGVAGAVQAFKTSAVSSFGFVESLGLGFGAKLLAAVAGRSGPAADGLPKEIADSVAPRLVPSMLDGRPTGLEPARRVAQAEGLLRGLSLTGDFARLVVVVGHGASAANNPHLAGLHCGACGGHTGEANARVAADVLNDPAVRGALADRGIAIPADTWFLGALHDTTTDEVTLFDRDAPDGHAADLRRLRGALAGASSLVRQERAPGLALVPGGRDLGSILGRRSRDWSQVRPEWGLAGNAAFVVAPRARTRGASLQGRAFLHSYDWQADKDFAVLTQILTAPLVVASWINLQYYGSSVDNRAFGAGDKTLHNVVGRFGVLEGAGGDLRTGLPWQSVHDGERLRHEPLRLSAYVEAPAAAIDGVLARHAAVRDLVQNGWIHLFRIAEDGGLERRTPSGWSPERN
ncbi:MAG: DUF2309 domain-containing protein [Alsobacter sp.]